MTEPVSETLRSLVEAALPHVPFDGWTEATLRAAAEDSGLEAELVKAAAPRGALDLALAFHRMGDLAMVERLEAEDLSDMRFRDKAARAVQLRLEVIEDREAVRRGATLFALPQNAFVGAQAMWGTADAIWTALGDTSEDLNWYSKRATLSGVLSATVLYWLGDDSMDRADTWAFLDRRIEEVMQIEKVKAQVNKLPGAKMLMAGPNWLASMIRRPQDRPQDVPGVWQGGT
ncbi:MAG: COQ9 family protein [Pseudomonadota bacterium]